MDQRQVSLLFVLGLSWLGDDEGKHTVSTLAYV